MELMAPATLFRSRLHTPFHLQFVSGLCKLAPNKRMSINMLSSDIHHVPFQRSYKYQLQVNNNRRILSPPSAASSGFEATMLDAEDSKIRFKMVDIVVESNYESKIQLRVDLPGEETQKAFDVILLNLARSAPPIPGFRRQKGDSQIYAIRQSIAKALITYHQRYVDEQTKKENRDILGRYDRTLPVADPWRCEPKKFGGRGARSRIQKSNRGFSRLRQRARSQRRWTEMRIRRRRI